MSRHRTDPGAGGRLALTVAAIAAVVALAGVGGSALFLALTSAPQRSSPSTSIPSTSSSSADSYARTLTVKVTGRECHVFVSVPGGEVLIDRTLQHGESVRFDDPQLAVVLSDGGAAEVHLNGALQRRGTPGLRLEFEVSKTPPQS
jgi:hypothetical protein